MALRSIICSAAVLTATGVAFAYIVGLALGLDKLNAEANLIFKGTAVSGDPVQDGWFKPCPGFAARETQFKVISVLKGDAPGATLRFRHYDKSPQPMTSTITSSRWMRIHHSTSDSRRDQGAET